MRRFPVFKRLLLAATLAAASVFTQSSSTSLAATPEMAPLDLGEIGVQPPEPGPETLCELRLKIQNRGTLTASRFAFSVKINGVDLPVYKHLRYFQAMPPQATTELRLYNFWSTETSRPMPQDAKLKLEVQLIHAEWVRIEKDGKGADVWTPMGEIKALPAARLVSLQMTRPAK